MAWVFGIGTTIGALVIMYLFSVVAVMSFGATAATPANFIALILLSICAGIDARKIEFEKYGGLLGRQKPWAIVVGCLLLFIVVFALYMTKRWQITHKQVQMLSEHQA